MDISRRTFFKVGAVGATALAGAAAPAEAASIAAAPHARGVLVDTTLCVGCRTCEGACAEANKLAEPVLFGDPAVFEQRRTPDERTYTVVNRALVSEPERYAKAQCMHCVDPACVSVCPGRALEKLPSGPVVYDGSRCLGCRYCMLSCQFEVPKFEYDSPTPYVKKCSFCAERQTNGGMPACAESCPTGALKFGERAALLEEARTRIYQNPDKYVHHIYGEREVGGTSWLYISDIPLDKLGLKVGLDERAYPELAGTALGAVPMVMTLWPPILMGLYAINRRREVTARHDAEETTRE
jgi:Fe-S-cluster-containing dehydrogenase component